MYLKNSNFIVYIAAAAVAGFALSFLLTSGGFQGALCSGDISKASVYNNSQDDPEMTVLEEKLRNDKEFFEQTKQAADLLGERMSSLAALSEQTARICDSIAELKANSLPLSSLAAKANNTGKAFEVVSKSLTRISEGKSAPAYEQASNNAFVGFQKIENRMDAGKAFVQSASAYLEDKDLEENTDLACIVAMWSVYCAEDAIVMDNDEDLKYWGDVISNNNVVAQGLTANLTTVGQGIQNLTKNFDQFVLMNQGGVKDFGIQSNQGGRKNLDIQSNQGGVKDFGIQSNQGGRKNLDIQSNQGGVKDFGIQSNQGGVKDFGIQNNQGGRKNLDIQSNTGGTVDFGILRNQGTENLKLSIQNFNQGFVNFEVMGNTTKKGPSSTDRKW